METNNSTLPYYLERNTKRFMSDFIDIGDIFTDFIIDFIKVCQSTCANAMSFK